MNSQNGYFSVVTAERQHCCSQFRLSLSPSRALSSIQQKRVNSMWNPTGPYCKQEVDCHLGGLPSSWDPPKCSDTALARTSWAGWYPPFCTPAEFDLLLQNMISGFNHFGILHCCTTVNVHNLAIHWILTQIRSLVVHEIKVRHGFPGRSGGQRQGL